MKIPHTADWQIGQLFYNYDRFYEHKQFLNWLTDPVVSEKTDMLIISSDIFGSANPAGPSVKLFYTYLDKVMKARPGLQIIITARIYDSTSKIGASKPLLGSPKNYIARGWKLEKLTGTRIYPEKAKCIFEHHYKKVPQSIEWLFVDESFSWLDPTALGIAMDALERLHNNRRKVGVISHVQEMTEQIPAQTKVSTQQRKKSKM